MTPAPCSPLGPSSCAAFPLGGIGTGTVSVGARGDMRDWEISNRPDKGSWLPLSFFVLRAATVDGEGVAARVLEGPIQPPYEGDSGYRKGILAGLPRMATSEMVGEYPIARITFADPDLPVTVEWEGFTPFIPLDADDSGIPGAYWRYTATNTSDADVAVSIAGLLANPIATDGRDLFHGVQYHGTPTVAEIDHPGLAGVQFGTTLADDDVNFGTCVLAASDATVTTIPRWPANTWGDGAQHFWDTFLRQGHVADMFPPELIAQIEGRNPFPFTQAVGGVCSEQTIPPGASATFEFVLAWHTPNRSRAWEGNIGLPNTHRDQVVRNFYSRRYPHALSVAIDLVERRASLEEQTRAFHAAVHGSTLPAVVRDAVASNLAALRSTTCFRLDDGSPDGVFAGWEGSLDHAGSCEGTCTHVWNYAQSAAHLFPVLERSARRIEFLHEVEPDGKMRYRGNTVFGGEPWDYHAAVDGQLGTIVRLYREYLSSGDEDFLRELWPSAVRVIDYVFTHWDTDGDGILDGEQHNTYDIEFYGPNPLSNVMLLAALRAASQMAAHVGDEALADRYAAQASASSARIDAMLYNGEYYEQRLEDVDSAPYQFGVGCLSDQLFGQTLAHLTGLGHLLPADHVRSALQAVVRYNSVDSVRAQVNVQRTYAINDEAGLLLCSWPRGGRPRLPFVYSDEVWTGVEYQVATCLIYEGCVEEALRIVAAVRARYDGTHRNPWNEIECGNHYVRSMASWGLVPAMSGSHWDAPQRTIALAPRAELFDADGVADFPVTMGHAWGRVRICAEGAALTILGGNTAAARIVLTMPFGRQEVTVVPAHTALTAGTTITIR
ncbi:MAG: GH116 family glycosyl hydrolase [Microbacterium sp.]